MDSPEFVRSLQGDEDGRRPMKQVEDILIDATFELRVLPNFVAVRAQTKIDKAKDRCLANVIATLFAGNGRFVEDEVKPIFERDFAQDLVGALDAE